MGGWAVEPKGAGFLSEVDGGPVDKAVNITASGSLDGSAVNCSRPTKEILGSRPARASFTSPEKETGL